jgi:hypothetical protein
MRDNIRTGRPVALLGVDSRSKDNLHCVDAEEQAEVQPFVVRHSSRPTQLERNIVTRYPAADFARPTPGVRMRARAEAHAASTARVLACGGAGNGSAVDRSFGPGEERTGSP